MFFNLRKNHTRKQWNTIWTGLPENRLKPNYDEKTFNINLPRYEWSIRVFSTLKKVLGVNIKMHHSENQLQTGSIFVFNHFARFETFIPQYLMYQEVGALCRSVAASEFFKKEETLSDYLCSVGAVPNNYTHLLPFLAEEILRGKKVIIFPEGGMVKDRRVLDQRGHYSVYSPTAGERRKHHTGAAVLALMLEGFKSGIRIAEQRNDKTLLNAWTERLDIKNTEALLKQAHKPTLIIPSNITFFPLRVGDNMLRKGVDLFSSNLGRHHTEELLIEGNLLLKNTDMDIRLGEPVVMSEHWNRWDRKLTNMAVREADSMATFFGLGQKNDNMLEKILGRSLRKKVLKVRNEYMHKVYACVTINLSHLASRLIYLLIQNKQNEIDKALFHKMLYLAVKKVQAAPQVYLHRSLLNPDAYSKLLEGKAPGVLKFIDAAEQKDLIKTTDHRYQFLDKLRSEYDFHEIRLENIISVYANEAHPVSDVTLAVEQAMKQAPKIKQNEWAKIRFDDELISYEWDKKLFDKPRYLDINNQETATQSAAPYLLKPSSLIPSRKSRVGILLLHGFLSSPAELRPIADELYSLGYTCIGVRLKGHGTSPWDLRSRKWTDWSQSVRHNYHILSEWVDRIIIVGFSTGGALALALASEQPEKLAGVVSVAPPLKFMDKSFILVPLVHGANRITRWIPAFEGVMPFRHNDPENPDINYRNIPFHALYELKCFIDDYAAHLSNVTAPVRLIQGTQDPVVDPKSAELLQQKLVNAKTELVWVDAQCHGILHASLNEAKTQLIDFITKNGDIHVK